MADALMLLRDQHAEVNALFMKLDRAGDPVLRAQIFRTIDANLRIHSRIEEDIFYPAFRDHAKNVAEQAEVSGNYNEHRRVKALLEEIERSDSGSEMFRLKMQQLKDAVQHHIYEEEHRMFKEAACTFTRRELETLGVRMEEAAGLISPVYEMAGPRV